LTTEEATDGMTYAVVNARASRTSGRTARREAPMAAVPA
jgi:hypothetical protein